MRALPLLLAACSAVEPAVQIGSGEVEFEPLVDGGEVTVVRGPQGGYHFFGSVLVAGIDPGDLLDLRDPSNPITSFQVFDGETALAPNASFRQGLDESTVEGWSHQMVGRLVVLDIADDDEINGREVRFEVTVEAADGTIVTDARDLTVVPHPLNDNVP
jgi:hypothetical protein